VKAFILENKLTPNASQNIQQEKAIVEQQAPQHSAASTKSAKAHSSTSSLNDDLNQRMVDYEDIEMNNIRKVIAKRLLQSKVLIYTLAI
jgi:pyruvate/2-oxoglutarate dehydrogenase complex dihydrolipoamide acyltransferase (E2) component